MGINIDWALGTYVRANLSGSIPDTNNLHITCNQSLALALLPIKHKPCIAVAWNQLGKSPESRDNFDTLISLIVAEKFDHTIRRSSHEEGLVILVDISHFVDL
jgi:hypothetical protein